MDYGITYYSIAFMVNRFRNYRIRHYVTYDICSNFSLVVRKA